MLVRIWVSGRVNGYVIRPWAEITFDKNRFFMFSKTDWSENGKEYATGFYV